MLQKLIFAFSCLIFSAAQAATSFTAVSQGDLDSMTKEFSSNSAHTSVMGAATLGKIFGFELSLVAGQNQSPNTDKVVKASSSTDSLPNLYHAGLLLAVSVPLGFTGEVIYTPKVTSNAVDFQGTSAALKYTFNQSLIVLPFNLALRAFASSSKLNFTQTTPTVTGNVENKNNVNGLQILISPSLPMLEPYAGIGYLQAKDSLSFSGAGNLFGTSIPLGTSSLDSTASTTQFLFGVNAHILLLSLGLEYSKAFDADRYTAKLGFVF